jgi:hypothetical protein
MLFYYMEDRFFTYFNWLFANLVEAFFYFWHVHTKKIEKETRISNLYFIRHDLQSIKLPIGTTNWTLSSNFLLF